MAEMIEFSKAVSMVEKGEAQFDFTTFSEGCSNADFTNYPDTPEYERAFNEAFSKYLTELDKKLSNGKGSA